MIKYVVIVVFVCVMIAVGIYSRKRTADVDQFFLGERDVGPWLSAFAYGTTYFSAVLFVGYAGKIGFGFGLSALWIAVGNALVGSLLAWLVLAKRTRLMTERLGAMTMPEYLEPALWPALAQDRRRVRSSSSFSCRTRPASTPASRTSSRRSSSLDLRRRAVGRWRSSPACTSSSAATSPWRATTSSRGS